MLFADFGSIAGPKKQQIESGSPSNQRQLSGVDVEFGAGRMSRFANQMDRRVSDLRKRGLFDERSKVITRKLVIIFDYTQVFSL